MVKMDRNEAPGTFKIHNVGFYNLAPRGIKCMSYNKRKYKLAVSRDDASIEIWDTQYAFYMEKCILGEQSASVEGLSWLNDRLFSAGQTGEVTEWDLQTLDIKHTVPLTGYTAFCMDVDESNGYIAVGTNEGFMNIFSVEDGGLKFTKLFDKQEGRILCCKYDSTGNYIVTGSTDTVRIWDVAKGHAIHRMTTSRSESKRETHVWSLVVLKDLTIIAGDSRGYITIWNGINGTEIASFPALAGDVLAVALNSDETMFCCSGVDPQIKIFVPASTTRRWIPNLKRKVHDHDVKVLTCVDDKIISGGTDGFINVSSSVKRAGDACSKFHKLQYSPSLPQPFAVVADSPRLLLLKYLNHLELWKLGRPNDNEQLNEDKKKKFLSLDDKLQKLVELKRSDIQPITCASISPNGNFLIYSTKKTVKLFQLDRETQKPSLTSVKVDSDKFKPCVKVLFSSNSELMYCVNNVGDINIFSLLYNDEVDIKQSISTKQVIDTISIVCLSKCGEYLVCAGVCGTVAVWKKDKKWKYFTTLPSYHAPLTAMEMHSKSCRIVLAYSDYKIREYDLTTNEFSCNTETDFTEQLQPFFINTVINNVILDENNENVVILQNSASIFVLEKVKANDKIKKTKAAKRKTSLDKIVYKMKSTISKENEYFVHLSWLSNTEAVAIRVDPNSLIQQLPPPMRQKLFGIS